MSSRFFPLKASKTLLEALDVGIWIFFLILIALISFNTDSYHSINWLRTSSATYGITGLYLIHLLLGGRANTQAVQQSKKILLLLAAIIAWQLLQISLPVESSFVGKLFEGSSRPEWWLANNTISIVPAQSKLLAMSNLQELVLFSLALMLVHSRARFKQLLFLLMLVGAAHAILAMAAKYGQFYLVDISQLDGHFDAARGMFVNRNHLAAFCSLTLVASLTMLLHKNHLNREASTRDRVFHLLTGWHALYLVVFLISFAAIILSQSRAGFLGVLVSGFLVSILMRPDNWKKDELVKIWVPITIVVLALILYFGQGLVDRLGAETLSLGERVQQWMITLKAIAAAPLMGYGGGSYGTVFQVWRETIDLRYVYYDQAHNHYLHLWLEQGLLGLALWIAVLVLSLQQCLHVIKHAKSSFVRSYLVASLVVVLAALLQSLVDYNLQIMNMRSYFFVIIALWFAAPNVDHKRRSRRSFDEGNSRSISHHSFAE